MQNCHIEITIAILHSVICKDNGFYNLKYRIKRLFVINKIQVQVLCVDILYIRFSNVLMSDVKIGGIEKYGF